MAVTWTVPLDEGSRAPKAGRSSSVEQAVRSSRLPLNGSAFGVAIGGLVAFIMGASRPSLFVSVVDGWVRMIGPAVLVFVAAVILLERIRPAEPRPLLARGHVQDLLYLFLYALVVAPFVVILNEGFFRTVGDVAPWILLPLSAHLPAAATFCLAFAVMDGCNWLGHWMNHRWSTFWRFHAVHHSQEELSVLTTFRAHPFVHVGFLLSVLPVVAISSGVVLPLGVISAYVCTNALTHANLRWSYGPLGKVFVSPMYHRLHHGYGGDMGVNLGSVLTLWDLLSRRAAFLARGVAGVAISPTGLAAQHVPIEQRMREWRPGRALLAQLAEPFAETRVAGEAIYQSTVTGGATFRVVDRSGAAGLRREGAKDG